MDFLLSMGLGGKRAPVTFSFLGCPKRAVRLQALVPQPGSPTSCFPRRSFFRAVEFFFVFLGTISLVLLPLSRSAFVARKGSFGSVRPGSDMQIHITFQK